MRQFMVLAILVLLMPITGSGWVEGSNVLLDPHTICNKTRRQQNKLKFCRKETGLLNRFTEGINRGFMECQFQFRSRRWNCTTLRRSMRKILMKDTRETAFVNAITAAGVAVAIAEGCSKQGCNITKLKEKKIQRVLKRLGKNPKEQWKWGDHIDIAEYALRKSQKFLDARYKRRRSDIKTLVKLHNNKAGRLAFRESIIKKCVCHGPSGSCILRVCWPDIPSLRMVGARLMERYEGATKVIARNDGNSFMPEGPDTIKPPTKYDLVYTDESPDYCVNNHRTGSIGTYGRICNATSEGVDGCDLLCCDRGYHHKTIFFEVQRNCVFYSNNYTTNCKMELEKGSQFTCR